MGKVIAVILGVLAFMAIVLGVSVLGAFPLKWTWNYVMPYLFGLKTIDFWQAFCLMWVAGALVKSTQTNNNQEK